MEWGQGAGAVDIERRGRALRLALFALLCALAVGAVELVPHPAPVCPGPQAQPWIADTFPAPRGCGQ